MPAFWSGPLAELPNAIPPKAAIVPDVPACAALLGVAPKVKAPEAAALVGICLSALEAGAAPNTKDAVVLEPA